MTTHPAPVPADPSAEAPLLRIRDLHVTFTSRTSQVHAVRGADLTIYPGQTVAIVGESGSGKSTTAHAIIDLLPGGGKVTGGSIEFDGEDLTKAPPRRFVRLRGSQIGLVPQDPMSNLNPVYRIGSQVREALRANGIDVSRSSYRALVAELGEDAVADTPDARLYLGSAERRALLACLAGRGIETAAVADKLVVGFTTRVEVAILLRGMGLDDAEALAERFVTGTGARDRVAGLLAEAGLPDAERRARQFPHEFSGGMRQRTLIAIALAARPTLLIADEPTSALDVTVQRQILDHLGVLTRELGTAVLFITHDLGLAAERAEHLVVMYQGKVVESGPSLDILANPAHPYTRRLVASAPSLAYQRIQVAKTTGEDAAEAPASTDGERSAERPGVLQVSELTKVFEIRGSRPGRATQFTAVDDVSFTLRRGTTLALVGESGSGKSTVANMVLGLVKPTAGRIVFDDVDTSGLSRRELFAFRRRVQPVFQDPYGSLDPMYSIYRIIEEPLRTHRVGTKAEREARVRELLDKVALPASTMRRYPNELSGGQLQRVAVARALALNPEVVVCDEAVSALDVLVQAQVLDLLAQLQSELTLSYLFITHDLAVVRQIADEVAVMQTGRIVEHATTNAVFDTPQTDYTRQLLDAIPGGKLNLGH
ncbi:MAG: ABC transporter ATP-binding protein [Bifidobacteriaceae bacterium]|nr:ABC transporter ATP-binding protein [Bifidobacteriaceae bacterium]